MIDFPTKPANVHEAPSPQRFAGKVAIVTGGARGIGRGIATELARDGATVVVNYTQAADAAADVVAEVEGKGGKALAVQADIGVRAEAEALVAAAMAAYGRVDVLVNNAGICPFRSFWEITDEDWDRTHRTNLYGAFVTSQAAAAVMRDLGGGAIVHVSSVSAHVGGPEQVHYCATKGGINAMTSSMAIALGPHNIRVNAVLPGGVHTDINRQHWQGQPQGSQGATGLSIDRPGTPWDIARAVCYLASDDAAWVTGAMLPVDGGLLVRA
jgi:NAD(P)-dependent dehydrogenase (short-subunit alcohol dehydrogenase family)